MQEQGLVGPRQERHYSKKMKLRYRSLSNEFITSDLVYYCGVNQRNAEKIVERWKSEGYIVMKEYGIYEKVILDLM
jgi:predicted transcriptional regulator